MSEIFHIRAPDEFIALTVSQLAELAHQAEDTNNDILLIQVADEIERRKRTYPQLNPEKYFREAYIALHKTRGKKPT